MFGKSKESAGSVALSKSKRAQKSVEERVMYSIQVAPTQQHKQNANIELKGIHLQGSIVNTNSDPFIAQDIKKKTDSDD